MAFWSQVGSEPIRQHRWYVDFGSGKNLQDMVFALKKVSRPKAKIGSVQHKYLNHFFNYPGRLEWEDISMSFAAVTQPNASKKLMALLKQAGYGVPSAANGGVERSTIGKEKFVSALGEFEIFCIDPDGATNEKWKIHRPFFTSVQFGDLDYANEDIVEIQTTVKYDWAELASATDPNPNDKAPGNSPNGNKIVP